MLDEAHERTLHTDIIVGLLKKVYTVCDSVGVHHSIGPIDHEEER